MKKIICLLLVTLLITVGCNNVKNELSNKSIVKVNGIELHLDKEKVFKDIEYTITDDLKEANFDQYVQYYLYQESGPNLLFFRIFFYNNKTHDYIRNDLAIDKNLVEENGKTDNIEYKYIDTKRTDGTIHFYIIDKDNTSYVINFVSQYDIKDFEKKVLNSIKFKE